MVLLRHRQQRSNTVKWKILQVNTVYILKYLLLGTAAWTLRSCALSYIMYPCGGCYCYFSWSSVITPTVKISVFLLSLLYLRTSQVPKHKSGVAGAWEAPGELLGASTKYHLTPTRSRNTALKGDHICICSWRYAARMALPYRLLLFILYCVEFITKAYHRCSDAGTEKQHRQGLEPQKGSVVCWRFLRCTSWVVRDCCVSLH